MVTGTKESVTDTDLRSIRCSALIARLIRGTTIEQRREAVDYIRQNAIVRELVATLMLSQDRVANELRQIAHDISPHS